MKRQPLIMLVGGMAALMVAMGVGRFAFTPILPLMLEHRLFSTAGSGYLAASNYLGYLLGAFVLTVVRVNKRSALLLGGLFVSVATTWGMSECGSLDGWLALRFLSGLASAVVFVIASSIVLEHLSGLQAGLFYGGVGWGILLTGLTVSALSRNGDWADIWKGLGAISFILGLTAWYALRDKRGAAKKPAVPLKPTVAPGAARRIMTFLIIAYGLEGLGYIVTGTYLVAYAKTISSMPDMASISWMVVGIAGAPSCIVWSLLAAKWGKKWTLTVSMLLQSIGIAIPVLIPSLASVLVGAALFGATFMGITTLFVAYAKDLYPDNGRKMIGLLTTFFGLGQMIGPLVAGVLISGSGGYHSVMLGAALIVLIGALSLPLGIGRSPDKRLNTIGRIGSSAR